MPGRHCYQLCRSHKCRFQMQMTVYKSRTDIPAAQICFFFTLVVSDSNDQDVYKRQALYIGPLFESVGHGYETTDYKKLDSRLGTNEDLTAFVKACHDKKIKVIFDGVFNHTGRDFFAFKDIQQNRENSRYLNWYCNVNFWGNNEYNDGFSYDNWGGYNLLVKLNQRNPEVQD